MLSRENRVVVAALALGSILFAGVVVVMPQPPDLLWIATFLLLFYGVPLIGPQIYLYLTDEGGEIPGSARARFLVALAVIVPLWAGSALFYDVTVANVSLNIVLGILSLVALFVYFVVEARHGYADFAEEAGLR